MNHWAFVDLSNVHVQRHQYIRTKALWRLRKSREFYRLAWAGLFGPFSVLAAGTRSRAPAGRFGNFDQCSTGEVVAGRGAGGRGRGALACGPASEQPVPRRRDIVADMTSTCTIGQITVGRNHPLVLIGGPCVLEEQATNDLIAGSLRDACAELGLPFIFKASFDKANRSSIHSARGPGVQRGLDELARIKSRFSVPVTTDVHEPSQAQFAAEVVDLLQVPAFLVRQTDLLAACAATGRPVNAKKGQFTAPSEMKHVIRKLQEGGCSEMMLTERGTFFGYHRLVNDFIGVGDLMELGPPVCFDVTHSAQLPGGGDGVTSGRPERCPLLARAAVAAGVDAIFMECHPDPPKALSDASTVQPLEKVPDLLAQLVAIRSALPPEETARTV